MLRYTIFVILFVGALIFVTEVASSKFRKLLNNEVEIGGFGVSLRSKTKTVPNESATLEKLPIWDFDGSSTGQATDADSDVFLNPVKICKDPFRPPAGGIFVLCETLTNKMDSHAINNRQRCAETIGKVKNEVCPCEGIEMGDQLWIASYLIHRTATEKFGLDISLDPKPKEGEWNGAGCHTNFSTEKMRKPGGYAHHEHIFSSLSFLMLAICLFKPKLHFMNLLAILCFGSFALASLTSAAENIDENEYLIAEQCGYQTKYYLNGIWVNDPTTHCRHLQNYNSILKYCEKIFKRKITKIAPFKFIVLIDNWCVMDGSNCKMHYSVRPYKCYVSEGPLASTSKPDYHPGRSDIQIPAAPHETITTKIGFWIVLIFLLTLGAITAIFIILKRRRSVQNSVPAEQTVGFTREVRSPKPKFIKVGQSGGTKYIRFGKRNSPEDEEELIDGTEDFLIGQPMGQKPSTSVDTIFSLN